MACAQRGGATGRSHLLEREQHVSSLGETGAFTRSARQAPMPPAPFGELVWHPVPSARVVLRPAPHPRAEVESRKRSLADRSRPVLDDDGGIAASCGSSRSRALPAGDTGVAALACRVRTHVSPGTTGTTGNATVALDPPANPPVSHQLLYRCTVLLTIETTHEVCRWCTHWSEFDTLAAFRRRGGVWFSATSSPLLSAWAGVVPIIGLGFGVSPDGNASWTWNLVHVLGAFLPGALGLGACLGIVGTGSATTGRAVVDAGLLTLPCGAWFASVPIA